MKKCSTKLTASLLAVPLMSTTGVAAPGLRGTGSDPVVTLEQPMQEPRLRFSSTYVKITEKFVIVGLDDARTIYRNSRGEVFYLDPSTGDMRFLSAAVWNKFAATLSVTGRPLIAVKVDGSKYSGPVTLLGVDAKGNVVQRNSKGEAFYLNPVNGDMVIVK